LEFLDERLLLDVELRRHVRRVVLARWGLERAEVRAVDLVALHELHVPQFIGDRLDRVQRVDQHPLVRLNQARERRRVLVGGIEDVGHVREAAELHLRVLRIEQVDADVPYSLRRFPTAP
jgi:hypothetical protein